MLMVADVLVSQADESGIGVDLDLTDDMDLVMIWLNIGCALADMEMMIWLTDGCADMDLVLIWLDD